MSSQAVAVVCMAFGLALIVVIGIRSVRGHYSSFYRISTVCLTIGLNLNTTESVTGDAMSEFGAMCFFVGAFVGAVLLFVDAFTTIQQWLSKRHVIQM